MYIFLICLKVYGKSIRTYEKVFEISYDIFHFYKQFTVVLSCLRQLFVTLLTCYIYS